MAADFTIISVRGEIGSGKTTFTDRLVNRWNFVRVSFAAPLKCEVYDALCLGEFPQGMPFESDFDTLFRQELVPLVPFNGPSDLPRIPLHDKVSWVSERKDRLGPLLQWWGTEYRRGQDDHYWLNKFEDAAGRYMAAGRYVCTDDARFDNELDLICRMGGKHVYVINPRASALAQSRNGMEVRSQAHASERLNDPCDPRHWTCIGNLGNLKDYYRIIDGLVVALHDAAPVCHVC